MREFCHGVSSVLLPAHADRPGVAVRHAPVGVAERLRRRVPNDAGAPTPTAPAPPRAETLCGPHHQATLRRLCRCERPPPPPPPSPPPPHPPPAGAPPPRRHLTPFPP